jgi:hypothetical protein
VIPATNSLLKVVPRSSSLKNLVINSIKKILRLLFF